MKRVLPFLLLFSLISCTKRGSIPVIGLDENGEEFSKKINKIIFKRQLKKTLLKLDQQLLPILEKRAESDNPWKLNSFSFDIGIRARVGIGPLRVTGQIGISATFKKTKTDRIIL